MAAPGRPLGQKRLFLRFTGVQSLTAFTHRQYVRKRLLVRVGSNGIYMTDGDESVEIGAVGDGYRATTTLILDLLSWHFMLQNKDKNNKGWTELRLDDIRGIVIIDEVEKHLHPSLQRKILARLQEKFKKVQFIVSTHSPLCVSGTTDIDSREWKIVTSYIGKEKHDVLPKPLPQGLRADQILVQYFDLSTTLSVKVEELISDYQEIYLKDNKSTDDKNKLKELGRQLEDCDYNLAESVKDRELQKKLLSLLESDEAKSD